MEESAIIFIVLPVNKRNPLYPRWFEDGSWLWADNLASWIISKLNHEGRKWVYEAVLVQQRLLSYGYRGLADKVAVAVFRVRGGLSLGEVADPGEQTSPSREGGAHDY